MVRPNFGVVRMGQRRQIAEPPPFCCEPLFSRFSYLSFTLFVSWYNGMRQSWKFLLPLDSALLCWNNFPSPTFDRKLFFVLQSLVLKTLISQSDGLTNHMAGTAQDFTKVGLSTLLWVRALIGTYDACKWRNWPSWFCLNISPVGKIGRNGVKRLITLEKSKRASLRVNFVLNP